MPQSLAAVYVHGIFSTKNRRPFLREKTIRGSLYCYLGGVSKELKCPPLLVDGYIDHVHLLVRFSRTITIADWMKETKRVSSIWLKQQRGVSSAFDWQDGYAVFSISQPECPAVKDYIASQEEHHTCRGFQDEMRNLMKNNGLEWDERYVWD